MANLRFGSSFLSRINPALENLTKVGAAPTDQQLAEDALYGVRGTRNPLARSIGGLMSALGSPVDVRTSSERISQDLSQIQNPSSNEGLIEALKIQNQYLQSPTARMANLAKIKEIQNFNNIPLKLKIDLLKEFTSESVDLFLDSGANNVALLQKRTDTSPSDAAKQATYFRDKAGRVYTSQVTSRGPAKITLLYAKDENGNDVFVNANQTSSDFVAPEGKLEFISDQSGESILQKRENDLQAKSEESLIKIGETSEAGKLGQYRKAVNAAIDEAPNVSNAITNTRQQFKILKEIETGGLSPELKSTVARITGFADPNEEQLKRFAKQSVLQSLKASFGGQGITEGERAYLDSIQVSLQNSKDFNSAILHESLRKLYELSDRYQYIFRLEQEPISNNTRSGAVEAAIDSSNKLIDFISKSTEKNKNVLTSSEKDIFIMDNGVQKAYKIREYLIPQYQKLTSIEEQRRFLEDLGELVTN